MGSDPVFSSELLVDAPWRRLDNKRSIRTVLLLVTVALVNDGLFCASNMANIWRRVSYSCENVQDVGVYFLLYRKC